MKNAPVKSIVIIGAGQLGYFLCEAARNLGVVTTVVTPDADAPAIGAADHSIICALDEPALGQKLADRADVVTFEFEAVPDVLLANLREQQRLGNLIVQPALDVLELLKNKATQKDWLVRHGFPTVPYHVTASPVEELAEIQSQIPLPFVQKAQQGGYDGYGVQIIRTSQCLGQVWDVPSIIEPFLEGVREIAVLCARSASGEIVTYEPAGLEFDSKKNILDLVVAPANISKALHDEAVSLAANVIERLDGVGVFAVEMFITAENELLINEVSPRVHNAGHHTLESCETSQFEQHVRAITGLPLGSVVQTELAVMKNILYADNIASFSSYSCGVVPTKTSGLVVYSYGKRVPRPGRKIGHATCLGADAAAGSGAISAALAELVSTRKEMVT